MAAFSPTSCANSSHVSDLSPQIARVIRHADRQHPADAVLRSQLREASWLTTAQRTEISRAVFAYYRWFGWLDTRSSLRDQIAQAIDLDRRRPQKLSDHELIAKAVP